MAIDSTGATIMLTGASYDRFDGLGRSGSDLGHDADADYSDDSDYGTGADDACDNRRRRC